MKLKKQPSRTFNNKELNSTTQSTPNSISNNNNHLKQASTHSFTPSNSTGIAISKDKSPTINSRTSKDSQNNLVAERSSTELINNSNIDNTQGVLSKYKLDSN